MCIIDVNANGLNSSWKSACLMMPMNAEDVLRGNTLRVYRYVLKNRKPTGVREVQRSLKLSSPRLAFYHLNKLEETGFLKKTVDGYVVDRVFLLHSVRLRRLLIPRYVFYLIFLVTSLIIQLTVFRPAALREDYVFGIVVCFVAVVFFLYETIKIVSRRGL